MTILSSSKQSPSLWAYVLGLSLLFLTATLLATNARASQKPGADQHTSSSKHRLDQQLNKALADLGPSAATAAIYREYEDKWDAELNRVYQLWLSELPPKEKALLRDSQRQWIKERDANIRLLANTYYPNGNHPPSMYVSFHAYACMNLTRERALQLLDWRECYRDVKAETTTE